MFASLSNDSFLVRSNNKCDNALMAGYPKNYIKELREAKGWSQEKLAQMVGTTNQYIGMMESGKRGLGSHWIKKISAALGCDEYAIFNGKSRFSENLSKDEEELLSAFRELDRPARNMYLHTLKSFIKKDSPQ
jgi:transcriptional regulator with XRE-family HTH domain